MVVTLARQCLAVLLTPLPLLPPPPSSTFHLNCNWSRNEQSLFSQAPNFWMSLPWKPPVASFYSVASSVGPRSC